MSGPQPAGRFLALFLLPALLFHVALVAWPAVNALGYSLIRWDGFREAEYVGLANFEAVLAPGGLFRVALWHNVVLLVLGGGATLALALFFAALLHRRIRGAALFRVAFFFPNVIAAVAVALLWVLLYSVTDFGMVNGLLLAAESAVQAVGLPGLGFEVPVAFLDSRILIWAMAPMLAWMYTGFYMVLFLAAMQSIPEHYYEAADIEGAPPLAQFFRITLPMIREVLAVGVIFLMITIMKFFDPVWVMENQRPNRASHVMATVLYQKVFTEYNIGYGAAVAVLLFVIVFVATLVSLRLSRKEAVEF